MPGISQCKALRVRNHRTGCRSRRSGNRPLTTPSISGPTFACFADHELDALLRTVKRTALGKGRRSGTARGWSRYPSAAGARTVRFRPRFPAETW